MCVYVCVWCVRGDFVCLCDVCVFVCLSVCGVGRKEKLVVVCLFDWLSGWVDG